MDSWGCFSRQQGIHSARGNTLPLSQQLKGRIRKAQAGKAATLPQK